MSAMQHLIEKRTLSLALVPLLSLLLLLVEATEPRETTHLHFQKHLQVAHSTCHGTLYPDLCVSTLASFPDLTSKSVPQVICSLVNHTMYEVRSSSSNCTGLRRKLRNLNSLQQRALDDCLQLFDHSQEEFETSMADLSHTHIDSKRYHDSQTLLSGAMTNVYTCLDGFADGDPNGHVRRIIQDNLYRICHHVSNSLAMLTKIKGVKKLQSSSSSKAFKMRHGYPTWLTSRDRRLLQAAVNETKFDLVVAKDGSGNFTTIGEAVAAAPNSTKTRHVSNNYSCPITCVVLWLLIKFCGVDYNK